MPEIVIDAVEHWKANQDFVMLKLAEENLDDVSMRKAVYYASLKSGSDGYMVSGLIETKYDVEFEKFPFFVPFLKIFKRTSYKWRAWLLISHPDMRYETKCFEGVSKEEAWSKARAYVADDVHRETLLMIRDILMIETNGKGDAATAMYDSLLVDLNDGQIRPAPAYNQILRLKQ